MDKLTAQQKSEIALRTIFAQTFNTEAGKKALAYICKSSGFQSHNVVKKSDGSIDTESMVYNEGRRGFYLELRKFIQIELLKEIEIIDLNKEK